eukprot:3338826-Rhodomonas_salina.1
MSGTDTSVRYCGIGIALCFRYAMSGTDVGYGATRWQATDRCKCRQTFAAIRLSRCAVLRWRMSDANAAGRAPKPPGGAGAAGQARYPPTRPIRYARYSHSVCYYPPMRGPRYVRY